MCVSVRKTLTKCRPSPASSSCPVGRQVSNLKSGCYKLKSLLNLVVRNMWKVSILVNRQIWVARLGQLKGNPVVSQDKE